MPNQFGGVGAGEAFGVTLGASILDAFKDDYDKRQLEDRKSKEMDYEAIMHALKDPNWIRTHTPSQAQMMREKALDILKPKKHGDIKQQLKDFFVGDPQRQPQGANVLREADQKPRANVSTEVVPEGISPADFPNAQIRLPPPPAMRAMRPEQTYGEMDIAEDEMKAQRILERQTTVEQMKETAREKARLSQNAEVRTRGRELLKLKSDAQFDLLVRRQMSKLGIFQDTPENRALATESIANEIEQKRVAHNQKLELDQARVKQIYANIENQKNRIALDRQKFSRVLQGKIADDPVIKGGELRLKQMIQDASSFREKSAEAHRLYAASNYLDDEALKASQDYENQAAAVEDETTRLIEKIRAHQAKMAGVVTLPNPPGTGGGGGARRSGVKLTEAEAFAAYKGAGMDDAAAHAAVATEKAKGANSRIAQ